MSKSNLKYGWLTISLDHRHHAIAPIATSPMMKEHPSGPNGGEVWVCASVSGRLRGEGRQKSADLTEHAITQCRDGSWKNLGNTTACHVLNLHEFLRSR